MSRCPEKKEMGEVLILDFLNRIILNAYFVNIYTIEMPIFETSV